MRRTINTLDAGGVDYLIATAIESGLDVRLTDTGTWRLDGLESLAVEIREMFYQLPAERLIAGLRRYMARAHARA